MKLSTLLANRLLKSNITQGQSKPVIRLAQLGVVVGFSVMIITLAVVQGFKKEISDKVFWLNGHITIKNYDTNSSWEQLPIAPLTNLNELANMPEISSIHAYRSKPAILKKSKLVNGLLIKGVEPSYRWEFIRSKLVQGDIPKFSMDTISNEIVLSEKTATQLALKLNDKVTAFFIQDPPRARVFKVVGIFNSGLEEYDANTAICHTSQIDKLNNWNNDSITAYQIQLKNSTCREKVAEAINQLLPINVLAVTADEQFPQIFQWLQLTDRNAVVVIVLMLLVAITNMACAFIIVVLNAVKNIGIIKSLGASNRLISIVFVKSAAIMIFKSLTIANIVSLLLCGIQHYFKLIPLDQKSYYISAVPIHIDWLMLLMLNIGTFLICTLSMLVPVLITSKITPIKAMQFS